jgi:Mrp family chromosome partitioning ATPase
VSSHEVKQVSSEMQYSLGIARVALALTRQKGSRQCFSAVLTSMSPAEGVTQIVTDIARYLCTNGRGRVIVIDLSGMGSLAKLLSADEEHLMGEFSNLHPTGLANLFLLAPQFLPARPRREYLRELLERLSREGGMILIDAPRVREEGFLEAAAAADGILLVLDPGLTGRDGAVEGVRYMKDLKSKVIGIVLNRSAE